ncbi:MAG: N-acetylmuramoyl-L-alanine amidase [Planctomycetes bacterium]|nr:N-acetylmuramoyl-L-alanine amidase [Planctomycetota bacterium]
MKKIPVLAVLLSLPPATAQTPPVPGTLSGKRIVISPGHGRYWHSTLGWIYQRPLINGLVEDVHTNEIAIDHLYRYLEGAGAKVIACRERGYVPFEAIRDNDVPATYAETGTWTTSGTPGYAGLTYRFVNASPTETATATWSAVIPADGLYPVYVFSRDGANRVTDALYRVLHPGGLSEVRVNQEIDGLRWNYLGSWHWFAGDLAQVTLSNESAETGVVIADAVRIGAGMGSIVRGGTTSGDPRWRECSRYWAEYSGAPSSVWDPCGPTNQDNCDDVTTRPNFAEWWGADAFVSLHTNASPTGTGSGTSTYIYNGAGGGSATPGSAALQASIHNRIVLDIQAEWDATWTNGGLLQANFGEVRELVTMPGCLIELAFHDNVALDNPYLHEPEFREISGRAIYRGIASYFLPGAPFVPEPPVEVAIQNQADGALKVRWSSVAGATGYVVYRSPNGKAFDDGTIVAGGGTGELALTGVALGEVVHARVASFNAGGVGRPTEVVAARAAKGGPVPVLLVSGFDRLDAFVLERDNSFDFQRQHAAAVSAAVDAGWSFDGANNEAVPGLIALAPYVMVDWILGEESTVDETFSSAEQALVAVYLAGGGNLFATGAEIGWDLDFLGSVADRTFYESTLGLNYVADDANTHSIAQPPAGSFFAGIPGFTFDDGTQGTYDANFPDVLLPSSLQGAIVLTYANGGGAAVRFVAPGYHVIGFGFPFETIVEGAPRDAVMGRVLEDLAPLPIPPQDPIAPGASRSIPVTLPGSAGLPFAVTGSLGNFPGVPIDAGRIVPLNPDPLFFLLLAPGNGVLSGNVGTLDPAGQATMTLSIPAIPGISGLALYLAGASFSGGALNELTNWVRVAIL